MLNNEVGWKNLSKEWELWKKYYRDKGLSELRVIELTHRKMRKLYGV